MNKLLEFIQKWLKTAGVCAFKKVANTASILIPITQQIGWKSLIGLLVITAIVSLLESIAHN